MQYLQQWTAITRNWSTAGEHFLGPLRDQLHSHWATKALDRLFRAGFLRYVQKCKQQQKWQKREHNGKFGKYGKNDNFARIINRAKHKAMRGPIKVGDTGEFGKYGKNDNFATFANKAKHKAMRGPIKIGDTGKFGKYGENDNFVTIANRAWKFTNGLIYNGY